MVPTESEVRRIFDRFQTEGYRNWPDGSAIASDDLVLAFGLFLWTTVADADEGGGEFLTGAKDPEAALTGDDGSRELTNRVNSSPVGRRYARLGDRLARSDWWEEVVVRLPNPSGLVWAYSNERHTWAAAALGERGVFLVSFPTPYTSVLNGLRPTPAT